MGKYNVVIEYTGMMCYEDVEAANEADAKRKAEAMFNEASDREIGENPLYDYHVRDCYRTSALKKSGR